MMYKMSIQCWLGSRPMLLGSRKQCGQDNLQCLLFNMSQASPVLSLSQALGLSLSKAGADIVISAVSVSRRNLWADLTCPVAPRKEAPRLEPSLATQAITRSSAMNHGFAVQNKQSSRSWCNAAIDECRRTRQKQHNTPGSMPESKHDFPCIVEFGLHVEPRFLQTCVLCTSLWHAGCKG